MNLVPRPFELRADKPANERNARRVSILIDIKRLSLDATTRYPRASTTSFRAFFHGTFPRRRARLHRRQNQQSARAFVRGYFFATRAFEREPFAHEVRGDAWPALAVLDRAEELAAAL